MLRYHRKVFFDTRDFNKLNIFTEKLNSFNWQYTSHCLDNLKYRALDIKALLLYIKGIELRAENIFEFYIDEKSREIIKACYRINWKKDLDIILVIGTNKQIISLYINESHDLHYTLKENLYCKG